MRDPTAYPINGVLVTSTAKTFFANGRDHMTTAYTQCSSGNNAGDLSADTRSPYGNLDYGGSSTAPNAGGNTDGESFYHGQKSNGPMPTGPELAYQFNQYESTTGQSIIDSVKKAISDWHVNFIRIPISQDRWWNAVDGKVDSYRATVDSIVGYASSNGVYVDIDLHWSNGGTWGGSNPGQYNMPDDNTTPVLADIASRYASNPYVILGIYNEPRDVSWSIWLHGGQVVNEERKKGVFVSYHTPGMQALVNSVRKAGFNNVVSVSGLDWGFDLRGIAEGFAISDSNVMYEAHVYPNKKTESWWDENVSIISAKYPILIGEFGATFDTTKGTSKAKHRQKHHAEPFIERTQRYPSYPKLNPDGAYFDAFYALHNGCPQASTRCPVCAVLRQVRGRQEQTHQGAGHLGLDVRDPATIPSPVDAGAVRRIEIRECFKAANKAVNFARQRSACSLVEDEGSRLHSITGLVGSLVSGIFLYIIGVLNLTLFVKMVSILRKFRNGVLSEAEVEATISEKGFTNRVATRISAGISRSWHMFPIGFLFGLGFDTATEISLLFIAAGAASSNIPWFATMCLPVLFAAGMSLLDTIDGLLMNFAYGWAFTEPLRKIHYNIAITGLSVAVALVVGSIEIVQVVASNSGLSGGFWDWWANIDLNIIGFAVVGSFLAAWVIFYAELYVKAKR
eukprot:SM000403S15419  [mRNA]  locus=s403:31015:46794:+ [translate_table: standard]